MFLILFALFSGWSLWVPIRMDSQGRIPPHTQRTAATGIDPNTADWYDLALLPGVGETLARRIVSFREEAESTLVTGRPIFETPADLMRVRGIGARTVQRIAPFLRFPPPLDAR
ncbi:MAG: ComEA family DNA-binding protein [Phycisphaerae bacterium]